MTLADGRSAVGLESSVIDVSGDQTYLLRHGAITAEDIARLGIELSDYESDEVKSPGQLLKLSARRASRYASMPLMLRRMRRYWPSGH